MNKTLIMIGAVLIGIGVLWPLLSRLNLGRLPGDINYQRDGFHFYFPLTTGIIISIVLSLLLRFFHK